MLEARLDQAQNFALVDEGLYVTSSAKLQYYDFATARLTPLIPIPGGDFGLTVSPDGRSILYSQSERESGSLMLVENFR